MFKYELSVPLHLFSVIHPLSAKLSMTFLQGQQFDKYDHYQTRQKKTDSVNFTKKRCERFEGFV